MTDEVSDRLIRATEAARLLGLSRQHVYRLADRGLIRVVRIGTAVRVPVSEVQRVMREGIPA
jgi:excisionase family DNA binding protein